MGWTNNDNGSGDGDYDDEDVQVPVGYYWGELSNVNVYENDSGTRIALSFNNLVDMADEDYSEVDGTEVEVPLFMPAKVSFYDTDEVSNSALVDTFQKLGLAEALYKALGKDEIESGDKFVPETDDEADQLETAIEAVLADKQVKIDVNDLGEDASVVDKVVDYRDDE